MTQTKSLPVPFEVKGYDSERRTFEGLAATWDTDLSGERIQPGAFRKTIAEWKQSGRIIKLYDQHAYHPKVHGSPSVTRHTLGKLLEAEETSDGLWVKQQVARTAAGSDLQALLEDGMVDSMSIGGSWEPRRNAKGYSDVHEVNMTEISVVMFPANPGARIDLSSVKSLLDAVREGTLTEEQREDLRDMIGTRPPTVNDIKAALACVEEAKALRGIASHIGNLLKKRDETPDGDEPPADPPAGEDEKPNEPEAAPAPAADQQGATSTPEDAMQPWEIEALQQRILGVKLATTRTGETVQ